LYIYLEAIFKSVQKTAKAIILQEDNEFGVFDSDLSALIMENCFESIYVPVKRVSILETLIIFYHQLKNNI
jgi:2-oxoisovalerate dehydrogenase E1 component